MVRRSALVQVLHAAIAARQDEPHARADVATLEAAIEILESSPIACDCKATGERPVHGHNAKRRHGACLCRGVVHQRSCADCSFTVARCEAHGSNKSVSRELYLHRQREHDGLTTNERSEA